MLKLSGKMIEIPLEKPVYNKYTFYTYTRDGEERRVDIEAFSRDDAFAEFDRVYRHYA